MEGAFRPDGPRRSAVALTTALTMVAALSTVGLPACKKSRSPAESSSAPEQAPPASTEPPPPASTESAPPSARPAGPTGTIRGTVKLVGTPPDMPLLQRGSDGFCARKEMRAETVLVGTGGALENAIVRIQPGAVQGWVPTGPIVVDQVDCMYRPRVQAGVRGQMLEVRNGDGTTHNVNARRLPWGERRDNETIFNRGQPPGSAPMSEPIRGDDIVKLKCDLHGWMQGYVVVSDNPYAGVTGADGSFAIEKAPAGSYTLESWHEYYGIRSQKVTVGEGETVSVEFTYDAEKDRPAQVGAR